MTEENNKYFNDDAGGDKKLPRWAMITTGVIIVAFIATGVVFVYREPLQEVPIINLIIPDKATTTSPLPPIGPVAVDVKDFKKFSSDEEFNQYITEGSTSYGWGAGLMRGMEAIDMPMAAPTIDFVQDESGGEIMKNAGVGMPDRVSGTNVQVVGIDEPDILKTDGKEIYYSPQSYYYYDLPVTRPMIIEDEDMGMPRYNPPTTKLIKAFPVDQLAEDGEIEATGELLLVDGTLVIFSGGMEIKGYDVTDPGSPDEEWSVKLDDNTQIVQARLYDDKIYLVSRTNTYRSGPCPIPLLRAGEKAISVRCTDIYHPDIIVPVNATYHISTINPDTGSVTQGISFVGSYDSTVYMSSNAIYVGYSYQGDLITFFFNFFKENADLFPKDITERVGKLVSYDISQSAKMTEFQVILEEWESTLSGDERLMVENEFEDRMQDYTKAHHRDLLKTDIVKIAIDDFEVEARGVIPGRLLNQFSLDEYKNNLRAAVTVEANAWLWGWGSTADSENDIYVLDQDMDIVGQIQGLGLDERIYSARFIEDKGYLVTFKQIDPFFVLDLSNPKNPQVKGELKIPGYSAYLHPITKDKILGIGKEDNEVKVSLFDVSNPSNPVEADKYTLKEYWSDILNTHHAFLMDSKHQIFFLPGNQGGYVFSYKGDDIKLIKAVSGINAKRALFIDDYLYIAGDREIVVLDENSWERVKELDL